MGFFDRFTRFVDDVLLLPEDVRRDLETAETALEAEEYEMAGEWFRIVLASRPELVRALVGLTRVHEAEGQFTRAGVVLDKVLSIEPDDAAIHLWAARIATEQSDHPKTVFHCRSALPRIAAEQPELLIEACELRAQAEWRLGRPDRAARELRKAIAAGSQDISHRVRLVEALTEAGQPAATRDAVAGLSVSELDAKDQYRVGQALDRLQIPSAEGWLQRSAQEDHLPAVLLLAQRARRAGEHADAERHARNAIVLGGGTQAMELLAASLADLGRGAEAAEVLETVGASGNIEALRASLMVTPLTDLAALSRRANTLADEQKLDPAVLFTRAWLEAAAGSQDAEIDEGSGLGMRPVLLRAQVALNRSDTAGALDLLDSIDAGEVLSTSPDAAALIELRRRALRAHWGGDQLDLAGAIDTIAGFGKSHGLPEVERRARALRDELDRPLLLAVLGEFNAGKSTLINAFVGADVAPTGVVPTTATLNLLRGGAERRVRVVHRDGRTQEGQYEALASMLDEAEDDAVDRVEIVLPHETLERVWILDTPGTNALDPDHERLAKEAIRRADAAVWVWSAAQAGKATEERILATLRAESVVPVLNKADRLKPGELERVLDIVREAVGADATVVPISAKAALKAKLAGDEDGLRESGFTALMEELESRVFSRSRRLKRAACAARLLTVVADARAGEAEATAPHDQRADTMRELAGDVGEVNAALDDALEREDRAFATDQQAAFEKAAAEVIAFVRPRTSRFAKNGVDREDRLFLGDVLRRALEDATSAAERKLVAKARGILAKTFAAVEVDAEMLDRSLRAAVAPSFATLRGFYGGALSGGALRRFFEDVLPTAELDRERLAQHLAASALGDPPKLRSLLAPAFDRVTAELEAKRSKLLDDAQRTSRRLRAETYEPLAVLSDALQETLADASRDLG